MAKAGRANDPYVYGLVSRATPEMAKAGANLNLIADLAPLMVETGPFYNIEQMAEVCRLVKAG